jgi:glyoxylase-like metal-dependent hydrolase (beta-lactamase superfamily II)
VETDWTEPGAYPVADGVWRIPLPLPGDGLKAVNVYALTDEGGLTLVDGGWALEAADEALTRALAGLGAGLGDIRRFLVTHVHRDHYTEALAVRQRFGSKVLLGAGERVTIERAMDTSRRPLDGWVRLLLRCGAATVVEALRAAGPSGPQDPPYEHPDAYVEGGEQFAVGDRVLEAVPTPGHTRGHLVYLDRAADVLFTGDHVLPHITPSVAFELDPQPLALADYLASLHKTLELPDALMLPAHGPAGGKVHGRVDELLAHHDTRLAECAAAVTPGPASAYEAATQLGWTRRLRPFGQLDPFNQMLAVFETSLHLELLTDRGLLAAAETDGVRRFSPPAPAAR